MIKAKSQPNQENCSQCLSKDTNPLCSTPHACQIIDRVKVNCFYKGGQNIFHQGDLPLGVYVVQTGLVKLEVVSESGSAHTTRIIGKGGILGYRSLFSHEPYHAHAISIGESSLCFIPKEELFELFQKYPQISMNLMSLMCKDLRYAEEKWMHQIDKDAQERTAQALLFFLDHFHDKNWTRKEIAQWAGTTPETVMRTLAQFEKEGLIAQEGRKIRLLNRPILEKKSSPGASCY